MGRGRVEIKKIENANSRQVTFSKRRNGLLKKASELSILCDAEIALIIFSSTGRLFQYSSSSMQRTLSRYYDFVGHPDSGSAKNHMEELELLKDEIAKLQMKQKRISGEDLAGLSLQELHQLEQQLNEGLAAVKNRKEKLLLEQLALSKMQEKRALLENETLKRQVAEMQALLPPFDNGVLNYLKYPTETKSSSEKIGVLSSDVACNSSDVTLQLALPYVHDLEMKAAE